jgi:hypothetical protein
MVNRLSNSPQVPVRMTSEGRNPFGLSLPLLLALGVYTQVFSLGGKVLGDPDIYWHIAVGRWILAHRAVPHVGIFSGTMPHVPWVAHEWLSEIVLAWFFDCFGWAGLVIATALCVALALATLLRMLLGSLAPVHALIATILAYGLVAPHILARPHIFTLPILVAWVAALVRARNEDRAPSLWLVSLIILWANLHGGYVFGLGLAAFLGAEAILLAPDWPTRLRAGRGWAIFGVLSLIAALITPFGIDGLLLPLRLSQMSFALAQVVEWRSPDFQSFQPLELWIMFVLVAAFSLGWRLPLTRALLLLLLLHMALQHLRFGELLGLVTPMLVAPALAPQLGHRPLSPGMASLAKPARAGGVALAGVIFLVISGVLLRSGVAHVARSTTPTAALDAARAAHVAGPVLNDFAFGGYLIFSGVEPFIDGRAELYGDAFIRHYVETMLLERDQLPQLLTEYGITWTLISPNRPAVVLLDHLPGWHRLYADSIAVVHVRDDQSVH